MHKWVSPGSHNCQSPPAHLVTARRCRLPIMVPSARMHRSAALDSLTQTPQSIAKAVPPPAVHHSGRSARSCSPVTLCQILIRVRARPVCVRVRVRVCTHCVRIACVSCMCCALPDTDPRTHETCVTVQGCFNVNEHEHGLRARNLYTHAHAHTHTCKATQNNAENTHTSAKMLALIHTDGDH